MPINNYTKLREETDSGDIAYARGEVRPNVTPEEKDFLKDTSVDQNKKAERNALKGRRKRRQQEMKEEIDNKMPEVKKQIVGALKDAIRRSRLSVNHFIAVFKGGRARDLTPGSVLIPLYKQNAGFSQLMRKLPDDIGELELTLNAAKDERPLAGYEPFDGYANLFGATIAATLVGTAIIYEGYEDMNFSESEKLIINDVHVLDRLEKALSGVKVSGKTIYPQQGIFTSVFYRELRDVLLSNDIATGKEE